MDKFASPAYLQKIVADQNHGIPNGIYSICSAHPDVIRAGFHQELPDKDIILIESTCNQVNQDGGYTGMKPADFNQFVTQLAENANFPINRIILGGDHLGPNPWKNHPAAFAMEKAQILVRDYVKAGYRKIHLDTSMALADDAQTGQFDIVVEANRAASLCLVAESAWQEYPDSEPPVYVIGSEVPVPGGAEKDDEGVQITKPESILNALSIYQEIFKEKGLSDAWDRVLAVVVQPGVEFSQFHIHEYDPMKAKPLSQCIEGVPNIVFEAHSTDYQRSELLKKMVSDHFAILKVGPALTFAFREAVFALSEIENELSRYQPGWKRSNLVETIDQVMVENPQYWKAYYPGAETDKAFSRKYSFSDRIRYYWPNERVNSTYQQLISNLNKEPMPLSLISQYCPRQYEQIRDGKIENGPEAIIFDQIQYVIKGYQYACNYETG